MTQDEMTALERGAERIAGMNLAAPTLDGSNPDPDENDPMFDDAVRLVFEFGKASKSLLQRRLRIDYGRAAHLIDLMERDGLVGAAEGTGPRELLKAPARALNSGKESMTDEEKAIDLTQANQRLAAMGLKSEVMAIREAVKDLPAPKPARRPAVKGVCVKCGKHHSRHIRVDEFAYCNQDRQSHFTLERETVKPAEAAPGAITREQVAHIDKLRLKMRDTENNLAAATDGT